MPRGAALLADPLLNKGTAFTERERDALGLRGLLPPRVFTLEEQLQRSLAAVRRKSDALEKYIYLTNLQNRNEVLFYRLVVDHVEEIGAAFGEKGRAHDSGFETRDYPADGGKPTGMRPRGRRKMWPYFWQARPTVGV